jgi:hypothetical protein
VHSVLCNGLFGVVLLFCLVCGLVVMTSHSSLFGLAGFVFCVDWSI